MQASDNKLTPMELQDQEATLSRLNISRESKKEAAEINRKRSLWFTISKEQKDERRVICNNCERRMGILCRECGCIIMAKTAMSGEKCPLDKWLPIEKSKS